MHRYIKVALCLVVVILMSAFVTYLLYTNDKPKVDDYFAFAYHQDLYRGDLFAKDLCVTDTDIILDGYTPDSGLTTVGLYDVDNKAVLYADSVFEKIYPASTTKIMTAYLTLKYGNLDDIVTITESAFDLGDPDAVLSGLEVGDELTLRDLLYCLLLYSGNDCGLSIAEHISGSKEAFIELMNQEAKAIGATQTNFCNPHGLHDEEHYTTGYDLYLMFNACIQYPEFLEIISAKSYTAEVKNAGVTKKISWRPTNYYSLGKMNPPEGVSILGGKTGTTDEAGCCVVLYGLDEHQKPFISVTMGAEDRDILYENTNALYQAGIIDQ